MIELTILASGRSPLGPAVGFVEDVEVHPPFQRRLGLLVLLQPVEVLQEQQPRGLFGVVQLSGAAGLFPKHIVDIPEGLLEHRYPVPFHPRHHHRRSPRPADGDTPAATTGSR